MKTLRAIEAIMVLASFIGLIFSVFWFMEERHASKLDLESIKSKNLKQELLVRKEIIERDLKDDAEARFYYDNLSRHRELEPVEEQRLEFLEEQVQEKQDEVQMYEQKLIDLEE